VYARFKKTFGFRFADWPHGQSLTWRNGAWEA
jgi:hypothetical protein